MRKLLLVAAATLGLGACAYPETKMEAVEPTPSQMQNADQQQQSPPADDATSGKPASAKSSSATR
jgi:hypothetical protein